MLIADEFAMGRRGRELTIRLTAGGTTIEAVLTQARAQHIADRFARHGEYLIAQNARMKAKIAANNAEMNRHERRKAARHG